MDQRQIVLDAINDGGIEEIDFDKLEKASLSLF